MKSIMISGTGSGVGKTTVTTALLALLKNPSPFKCGPDYIDPMLHTYVAKKQSVNLDIFMLGEENTKFLFQKHRKKEGISVVEGMMGLYDGLGHSLDNYSGAHIARVLEIPVILVVDAKKMSTSIAAIIKGYQAMDPRVNIQGVILNRASEKTYAYLEEAIKMHTGLTCFGYLPDDPSIAISERHLGLLQAQEIIDLEEKIIRLKEIAKKTLNIKKIQEIPQHEEIKQKEKNAIEEKVKHRFTGKKVGIARDKAFSFYYEDNLRLMEIAGMELIYFSPMEDEKIPEVDILYFGGGYPEVYGETLSQNTSMIESIQMFHEKNGLIYGECGGMMYLSRSIFTLDKKEYPMVGIYPHKIAMKNRLNIERFGYIDCKTVDKTSIRGHEFHYSKLEEITGDENYYMEVTKVSKRTHWKSGFRKKNTIAGYPHIHFYGNADFFLQLFEKVNLI